MVIIQISLESRVKNELVKKWFFLFSLRSSQAHEKKMLRQQMKVAPCIIMDFKAASLLRPTNAWDVLRCREPVRHIFG